jgi:uncharacterized protein (DUF305 family)
MKTSTGRLSGRVLLAAALVAVPAPTYGQEPPAIVQPGAPGEPTRTLTADEAAALGPPSHVSADVRFMQGMIYHHAQALQMTDLLAIRTESEKMRLLARRIDVSQSAETEMMKRWLEARSEEVPDLEKRGAWPLDDQQLMPGMLTAQQMAELSATAGEFFDRLFLEYMIVHHEGALAMLEQLFLISGAGQEPQVFQFITHVDADQSMEIARMGTMLLARR